MRTFTAFLMLTALIINAEFTSAGPASSLEDDFYTTDELGGYHFGYNAGRIAHQEERSPEGVVRGAYSYIDADGQIQVVSYTADKDNGFVASGTNIPRIGRIPEVDEVGEIIEETPAGIVEDTPEVAAAKVKHAEAFKSALLGEVPNDPLTTQELPLPVEYSPEVAAARVAHFNAYNQEYVRSIGEVPVVYASKPVANIQYHPDYLPYANL